MINLGDAHMKVSVGIEASTEETLTITKYGEEDETQDTVSVLPLKKQFFGV